MKNLTFLALMRRFAPLVSAFVYCVMLATAWLPANLSASCCGLSGDDCAQGNCTSEQRRVKYKWDGSAKKSELGTPENDTWEWEFRISADGMETITGTITTSNVVTGEFCAPLDSPVQVLIIPINGTPTTLKEPSPDLIAVGSGTGGQYSTGSQQPYRNNPPTVSDVNPSASYMPTGPCLLKFDWCAACGDPGKHCAPEGSSHFIVRKVPVGCPVGFAQASNGSVDFRVNLGRDVSGNAIELLISQNALDGNSFDPAHAKFPAILNRYELEVWHWFACSIVGYRPNFNTPIHGDDWYPSVNGRRYVYRYVGDEGYKALFMQKGISPAPRVQAITAGPPAGIQSSFTYVPEQGVWSGQFGNGSITSWYPGWFMSSTGFQGYGSNMLVGQTLNYDDQVKQVDRFMWKSAPHSYHFAQRNSVGPVAGAIDSPSGSDGSLDDYIRGHLRVHTGQMPGTLDGPNNWRIIWDVYEDNLENGFEQIYRLYHWFPYTDPIQIEPLEIFEDFPAEFFDDQIPFESSVGKSAYIELDFDGLKAEVEGEVVLPSPVPVVSATYHVRNLLTTAGHTGTATTGGATPVTGTFGPDVCIEIEPFAGGASGYTIWAYWRKDVTFAENGTYTKNAPAFAAWAVKPGAVANSMRIEERRVNPALTTAVDRWYEWRQVGDAWTLNRGEGVKREIDFHEPRVGGGRHSISQVRELAGVDNSVFCPIVGGAGAILSHRETETNANGDVLVERDGLPIEQLVTNYTYNPTTGKKETMSRTDGSFEIYGTHTIEQLEYDMVLRPAGGTFFTGNPTFNNCAATLTRSTTINGVEATTSMEYHMGQLMSVSETTTKNVTVDHLDYRPPQPAQRVTTERWSSALPSLKLTSVTETYGPTAVASLAGRAAYQLREDGSYTIYHHYPPGHYDPSTGNFFQGQGRHRQVWEQNYEPEAQGKTPFTTQHTITVYDPEDREVEQRVCVFDGENDALISLTSQEYGPKGDVIKRKREGVSVFLPELDAAGRVIKTRDETGAETVYGGFDSLGRPTTVTQQGFPSVGDLPAIPERETTYVYDVLGRVKRQASGGFATDTSYDTRGRIVSEVQGTLSGGNLGNTRTTSYVYSESVSGTMETVTLPNGPTRITTTSPGGNSFTTGTGVVGVSSSVSLASAAGGTAPTPPAGTPAGAMMETSYVAGELKAAQITDGFGRTLGVFVFACDAAGNRVGTWNTYEYDSSGRLWKEYAGGQLSKETSYPFSGVVQQTVYASPSPNQVQVKSALLSNDGTGWWRVEASMDGVRKTRISPLLAPVLAESVFVDTLGVVTTQKRTVDLEPDGVVTQTTIQNAGPGFALTSETISRGGLVQSKKTPSAERGEFYEYDNLGRQKQIKTADGMVTSIQYDPVFGQVESASSSSAFQPGSTLTTMTYYPPGHLSAGLLQSQTTDNNTTNFSYNELGQKKAVWGATYPVRYEYDSAGRLEKMHTYRTASSGEPTGAGDVTEWKYRHGALWKKLDADQKAVTYGYNTRGQLASRQWARGVTTSYAYDNAGQLIGTTYSGETGPDFTPSVTYTRDSRGFPEGITDILSHWYIFEDNGALFYEESQGSDFYDRSSVTHHRWQNGIYIGPFTEVHAIKAGVPITYTTQNDYTSSNSSGMWLSGSSSDHWLISGNEQEALSSNATYHFSNQTGRYHGLTQTVIDQSPGYSGTRTYEHNIEFDGIGRTTSVKTRMIDGQVYGPTIASAEYSYNGNGLRETMDTERGNWIYGYNSRMELTGGQKKIGSTDVPGYGFAYQYDSIGNRTSTTMNGLGTDYPGSSTNNRNQYTQRVHSGSVTVSGRVQDLVPGFTPKSAAVAVESGNWFDARPFVGGYFARNLTLSSNPAKAVDANIHIEVVGELAGTPITEKKASDSRRAILPPNNEEFDYDLDGNLLYDGLYDYEWDAENRLTSIAIRAASWTNSPLPQVEWGKITFQYDWRHRRLRKNVYGPDKTTLLRKTRFVYDDWNLVHELVDYVSGADAGRVVTRNYVWAPDLSGTLQGAGGVGGLQVVYVRDLNPATGEFAQRALVPAYDGNGNVTAYAEAGTGTVVQEEEYGPFGESMRARNTTLLRCPIGWSTKYTDEETGLVYYGYRYYSPNFGRWISRDPAEESGGTNIYAFTLNAPQQFIDPDGLRTLTNDGAGNLILHFNVAFDFTEKMWPARHVNIVRSRSPWTNPRMWRFATNFRDSVEKQWNNPPGLGRRGGGIRVKMNCGVICKRFVPKIKIHASLKGAEGFGGIFGGKGDTTITVLSDPTESYQASFVEEENRIKFTELDIKWVGNNTMAHEFGHYLGLKHPGHGFLFPLKDDEYRYRGFDNWGRFVDGRNDLMGEGNDMRIFYYEAWAREYRKQYPKCIITLEYAQ